jgi:hypothetical protein
MSPFGGAGRLGPSTVEGVGKVEKVLQKMKF